MVTVSNAIKSKEELLHIADLADLNLDDSEIYDFAQLMNSKKLRK